MLYQSLSIAGFLALGILSVGLCRLQHQPRHAKGVAATPVWLPPGPRPLPIVGNALQLLHHSLPRTLGRWRATFGDLIFLRIFEQPTLVINSLQVAREMLEVKGAKYSDRPPSHFMRIIGFDGSLAFLPYGGPWRRGRRWIQTSFVDQAVLVRWRPLQHKIVTELLSRLAQDPGKYLNHIKHCMSALLLESTYGPIRSQATLEAAEAILRGLDESRSTAAVLVDHFPSLQYIPSWMPFSVLRADVWSLRPTMSRLVDELFQRGKTVMVSEGETNSFVASLLEQRSPNTSPESRAEEEEEMKWVAITLYLAGFDALEIALKTFFLVMTIHQDVYARAQRAIDEVVGKHRLPELSDRASLPYVNAILKEIYRINVPLPISLPRRVNEDDQYRDFHIPKGASVIANLWQMGNDPDYYSDPDVFRPERFIASGAGPSAELDPEEYVFSFGRRICPGQRFADDTLWLVMASIMATFDIKRAVDDDGEDIIPPMSFSSGLTSHPQVFACSIRPRSQHAFDSSLEKDFGDKAS